MPRTSARSAGRSLARSSTWSALTSRSFTTWTLAALLLFGNLGGALHLALVQHAICPEHGELIHVSADTLACAPAPIAPTRAAESGTPLLRKGLPPARDQHEHCAQGIPIRQSSLVLQAAPAWRTVPCECSRPQERETSAPLASIPRILLAPKHSPPALESGSQGILSAAWMV
jgi:hypothetical protein